MDKELLEQELLKGQKEDILEEELPDTDSEEALLEDDVDDEDYSDEDSEDDQDEPTLEDAFGGEPAPKESTKKTEDSVPLAAFLELKNELKELKQGKANSSDYDELATSLASRWDIDKNFVQDLVDGVKNHTAKEIEAKYKPMIEQQRNEQLAEKKERMFEDLYKSAVRDNDALKGIVNKKVIKALAFDPANSKKTVKQLIKEVYGNIPKGGIRGPKDSFEQTKNVSKKDGNLDFSKMDDSTRSAIKKDPKAKAAYGEWLVNNVNW